MLDLLIILIGFLFVILSMAFVINPPEAWIKRAFYGKQQTPSDNTRTIKTIAAKTAKEEERSFEA